MQIFINNEMADRLADGTKTQHRVPLRGQTPPVRQGDMVEVVRRGLYGNHQSLGLVCVTRVELEQLENISDSDILAEGYSNWTQLARDWNAEHAGAGFPWEINPGVWVIHFIRG